MSFQPNQLGRAGRELLEEVAGLADAAGARMPTELVEEGLDELVTSSVSSGVRQSFLKRRGLELDGLRMAWRLTFRTLVEEHLSERALRAAMKPSPNGSGNPGEPLLLECVCIDGFLRDPRLDPACRHTLVPPTRHTTLRALWRDDAGNASDEPRFADGTPVAENGSIEEDVPSIGPPMEGDPPPNIYIVDTSGEILVSREDVGLVKHGSVSGGWPVLAAGELGFKAGKLMCVNLRSGHYIHPLEKKAKEQKTAEIHLTLLPRFVVKLFEAYEEHFSLGDRFDSRWPLGVR